MELGEADQLFLNEGSGRFKPVSFTGGAFLDEDGKPLKEAPRDWGLAVQFHDFTGDGQPDIYVCNDLFTPDRIWINQGKGVFRAIARHALRNMSTFSMGVDFADVDRDGDVDFLCGGHVEPGACEAACAGERDAANAPAAGGVQQPAAVLEERVPGKPGGWDLCGGGLVCRSGGVRLVLGANFSRCGS